MQRARWRVEAVRRLAALAPLLTALWLPMAAADIRIAELSDVRFGTLLPTAGPQTAVVTYCVALDPAGRYQMTASGDGPGGELLLHNAAGQRLPYRAWVNDRGRARGTELLPGQPVGGLRGKRPRGEACRPPPGRVTVEVGGAGLEGAAPGAYRGTLTLTVAPE